MRCLAVTALSMITACAGPPSDVSEHSASVLTPPLVADVAYTHPVKSAFNAVAIRADGGFVVAGAEQAALLVIAYRPDGTPAWPQPTTIPVAGAAAHDIAIDNEGRIYVGGSGDKLTGPSSSTDAVVAVLAADGSLLKKHTRGGNGSQRAERLSVIPTGGVYVAGAGDVFRASAGSIAGLGYKAADIDRRVEGTVMVGTTISSGRSTPPACRVEKRDAGGALVWASNTGAPGGAVAVLATPDGGTYALCSLSSPRTTTLVRLAEDGVVSWMVPLGELGVFRQYNDVRLALDPAGSVAVTAYGLRGGLGHRIVTVKVGADGNVRWDREYEAPSCPFLGAESVDVTTGPGGEVFVTGIECVAFDNSSGNYTMTTLAYSSEGRLFGRHAMQVSAADAAFAWGTAVAFSPTRHLIVAGWAEDDAFVERGMFARLDLDRDRDGLLDTWEIDGIDVEDDGRPVMLPGASPNYKDVFVEVDIMGSLYDLNELDAAMARVTGAYANAPLTNPNGQSGIRLVWNVDETNLAPGIWAQPWTDFDAVKASHFDNALDARSRALAYHYGVVADQVPGDNATGMAELRGNDLAWFLHGPRNRRNLDAIRANDPAHAIDIIAGRLMHELGHTHGLRHGGADDLMHKPNYHSIMNYRWLTRPAATDAQAGGWTLDYSRAAAPMIIEAFFDEAKGLDLGADHAGHQTRACGIHGGRPDAAPVVPENGPVNLDDDPANHVVAIDVNCDNELGVLDAWNDWSNLDLRKSFMGPDWTGTAHTSAVAPEIGPDELAIALPPCGDVPGTECFCVDGAEEPCDSACGLGTRRCDDGAWGACTPTAPPEEVCDDGVDQDCDGAIDDGCPSSGAITLRTPARGEATGSAWRSDARQPTFRWEPEPWATTYQVQIDDSCASAASCTFGSPEVDVTTASATFVLASPLPVALTPPVGRRYAWRVRGCSPGGCAVWSETRMLDVGRLRDDGNGDGYSDLLVGAPGQDEIVFVDRGAVHVFHGGPSGLASIPSQTKIGPSETAWSVRYAEAVAWIGDVDGDGFADAAVGAHEASFGGIQGGVVSVYRGSPAGLSATAQVIASPAPASGAWFGRVLAGGDVDGDGYADLAVSETGIGFSVGRVSIFRGGAGGLASVPAWTLQPPSNATAFGAGMALAVVGDVDGDGYAELAVGAPSASAGALGEGSVFVYRGGPTLGLASAQWIDEPAAEFVARFGSALRGGDVNNDGFADLIASAPHAEVAGAMRGAVFVYFGSRVGLPGAASYTLAEAGGTPTEKLGWALASGDLDGDGHFDVVAGTGRSADGVTLGRALAFSGATASVAGVFTCAPGTGSDDCGTAVSVLDADATGARELVYAAPSRDEARGAVWIVGDATQLLESPVDQADTRFGAALP